MSRVFQTSPLASRLYSVTTPIEIAVSVKRENSSWIEKNGSFFCYLLKTPASFAIQLAKQSVFKGQTSYVQPWAAWAACYLLDSPQGANFSKASDTFWTRNAIFG